MNCKICGNATSEIFRQTILKKYLVTYFHCPVCGFLQTEHPYWLKEAYQQPINITDTGILQRNLLFAQQTAALISNFFDAKGNFLDYAGGYGIFTRLMRDFGFNFFWHDPYAQNIFSRGFEYKNNQTSLELLTTFESFEHFDEPLKNLERMLKLSKNILFSTVLLPTPVPEPDSWWYYAPEHGQHISFYSKKTLEYIAQKYHLTFCTNNKNLHLFSNKKINCAHLRKTLRKSEKIVKKLKELQPSLTEVDANLLKDEQE